MVWMLGAVDVVNSTSQRRNGRRLSRHPAINGILDA